jgi:hypothetical protein
MVMTHMHPGEGTWNIRLWRSAVEPGIYKLELQDPKAEGVQTGTYPMRVRPTIDSDGTQTTRRYTQAKVIHMVFFVEGGGLTVGWPSPLQGDGLN